MSNSLNILTSAMLRTAAPSIFATAPHSSRSARYGYVSTIDVINKLVKADYVPVYAGQSHPGKTRLDHVNFSKHMIRFQQRKYAEAERVVGGLIPEVLLINSHNGASSFVLQAGLFRLVCTNGMVIQDADHGVIRVHHAGDIAQQVLEAADSIIEQAPKILQVTKEWDKIKLSRRQQLGFATKALTLRYGELSPITTEQAVEARRNEDEAPTLWRTFNAIQENLTQGGQEGRTKSGRSTKVRSIKSISNILTFNRGLWELGANFAKRVAAA